MDDAISEMTKSAERMQRRLDRIADLLDAMNYEAYMERITDWRPSFCIIPRRCKLTHKLLWFKPCVLGVYSIYGISGESPLKMKFHVDTQEFTIWRLKK